MTNENDREEARYKNLARNIRQFILSAEEECEHGIGCIECWDLYYEAEIIEIIKSFRFYAEPDHPKRPLAEVFADIRREYGADFDKMFPGAETDTCDDMSAAFQRMFCVSNLDMMNYDQKRLYETFKAGWTGATKAADKLAEELQEALRESLNDLREQTATAVALSKTADDLRAANDRLTKIVADLEKELATPILVNTARLADQLATERENVETLKKAGQKVSESSSSPDPQDWVDALLELEEAIAATEQNPSKESI